MGEAHRRDDPEGGNNGAGAANEGTPLLGGNPSGIPEMGGIPQNPMSQVPESLAIPVMICFCCCILPLVLFWIGFVVYTLWVTYDVPSCPDGASSFLSIWWFCYTVAILPLCLACFSAPLQLGMHLLRSSGNDVSQLQSLQQTVQFIFAIGQGIVALWGIYIWVHIEEQCYGLYESEKYYWLFFLFKLFVILQGISAFFTVMSIVIMQFLGPTLRPPPQAHQTQYI